jgi:hypothetical protein
LPSGKCLFDSVDKFDALPHLLNELTCSVFTISATHDAARKAKDAMAVAELEKNGQPPYGEGVAFKYNACLNNAHSVNHLMEKEERSREYLNDFFPSGDNIPEYGLLDQPYWFLGLIQGMKTISSLASWPCRSDPVGAEARRSALPRHRAARLQRLVRACRTLFQRARSNILQDSESSCRGLYKTGSS